MGDETPVQNLLRVTKARDDRAVLELWSDCSSGHGGIFTRDRRCIILTVSVFIKVKIFTQLMLGNGSDVTRVANKIRGRILVALQASIFSIAATLKSSLQEECGCFLQFLPAAVEFGV